MARIRTISNDAANGELKDVYTELIAKRGKLSEVLKVQSLHPASIRSHMALYMDIMFSKTTLSRAEKEMLAVVVSASNECVYCQTHHGAALNNYWKDQERVDRLKKDYRTAGLTRRETVMCEFAVHLTKNPAAHERKDFTTKLREEGLTDEGILDLVLVTAYFNFVNRTVLSLGVELEDDKGDGYKY